MRLHGGDQGFDSPAVHQPFAGKTWVGATLRTAPEAPETPSDNPLTNKLGAGACRSVGSEEACRGLTGMHRPSLGSRRLSLTDLLCHTSEPAAIVRDGSG